MKKIDFDIFTQITVRPIGDVTYKLTDIDVSYLLLHTSDVAIRVRFNIPGEKQQDYCYIVTRNKEFWEKVRQQCQVKGTLLQTYATTPPIDFEPLDV